MRITYLHQYFNTVDMPGGTRSFEFARRLVEMGHTVDLVTADRTGAHVRSGWAVTDEQGIRVHWTSVPYSNKMRYRDRIRAFGRYAVKAGLRAASLPTDVVYASSTPLTVALPGAYAARRRGVPMVLEVRDLWPEIPIALGALGDPVTRFAATELERFAYGRAARIVALSPGMREGIVAQGYPPELVSVISNACDVGLFADSERASAAFRAADPWVGRNPLVVYSGAVALVNGVDYLVRLASEMRALDPDVRFLVVGGGRMLPVVRDLAASMGVLDVNMRFIDEVPKRDMPAILGAATVAVSTVIDVPALHANSANKFFDAIAAGTPVATNHEGWLADLIRSRGVGLVMPAADCRTAARELQVLLRDADRLASMGAAARQLACTDFDRDRLAGELESVLASAVTDAQGTRSGRTT